MFAKLQSHIGDEFYIKQIPISLTNVPAQHGLRIVNCPHHPHLIATLIWEPTTECYILQPQVNLIIDQSLATEDTRLDNFSRIHLPCKTGMHFFTFILPLKEPIKVQGQPQQRVHDRVVYGKWLQEEKEVLKKLILQFGYGRWNKLQSKFQKPKAEIRAFANALVRSIVELLPSYDQGVGLLNLIEEQADDPYIEPNQRDWELQNLKQKLISISKRIVMLAKIRQFIKKFKELQFKKYGTQDKSQLKWDYLLGFIPSSSFYSQRPSIWWTRKHDSDLIRGVYKYGYTNHHGIREATDLCFKDLDTSTTYQEFPFPETLNKRVKKLVQIMVKIEDNYDFDNLAQSDDEEIKCWSVADKQVLFNLLCDYGVPIGVDGRQNWQELKDKLIQRLGKFDRNLNQLEKMVQTIRTRCEQILMKHKAKEFLESESSEIDSKPEEEMQVIGANQMEQDEFEIKSEDAQKFSKQTNMLHFIRKNILPQTQQLFQQYYNQLQKEVEFDIEIDNYDILTHDIQIVQYLSANGYSGLSQLKLANIDIFLSTEDIINRVEKLCSFFKKIRDQVNTKRKSEYVLKDDIQKKNRMNNCSNLQELVLPSQVNASLKLLALGRIIPTVFYHSEHNLFPVGYKSIRIYASIFTKGKRSAYTCEILEGQDGKPVFKVTSEEDVDNPIIRNSCTGCWVYICNKVNDLQDHKKQKVTISGTDRFGLLEPNVQRYLEELPNAEQCTKYKFKYRVPLQDY